MSGGDLKTALHGADIERPLVVDLDDAAAIDAALTGGKAAALARGRTAGLASLPGVVLTTAFSDAIDAGGDVASHAAVRETFERAGGDHTALVARSSSVVEDMASSSMAGQFDSIIGVRGFDAFVAAVTAVLDSRQRAGAAEHPIAVLVQPLIEPAYGGVMFGIDPVTGRTDRRVVSAVRGAPGAAGQRRGPRLPLPAGTVERQGVGVRRQRRPTARIGRPAATGRAVRQGGVRLRRRRRTSSGRSPTTSSCGCCSRAR